MIILTFGPAHVYAGAFCSARFVPAHVVRAIHVEVLEDELRVALPQLTEHLSLVALPAEPRVLTHRELNESHPLLIAKRALTLLLELAAD